MKKQETLNRGSSIFLARYSLLFVLLLASPAFCASNVQESNQNPSNSEAAPSLVQDSLSRLLETSVDSNSPEDAEGDVDYNSLINMDENYIKRAPGWGKRAPGWGKRAPGWGKRAPGWGKRAPGWGKRTSPQLDSEEMENMLFALDGMDSSENSDSFDAEKRAPGWGKRAPGWGKRAPGWGKRTVTEEELASFLSSLNGADDSNMSSEMDKRAPGWGKRAPGWGKRAPGWGKRAPGWGKRAPGWGKRAPGWGKRDTEKRAPGWGKRDTQGHNSASAK